MYLEIMENAKRELQALEELKKSNAAFFENWIREHEEKDESIIIAMPIMPTVVLEYVG